MIVTMRKITFVGLEIQKETFLERLQEIGLVHLILPKEAVEAQDLAKELARVAETRKFLAPRAPAGRKEPERRHEPALSELVALPAAALPAGHSGALAAEDVMKTFSSSPGASGVGGSSAQAEKPVSASDICSMRESLAQRESRLQAEIAALRKEIVVQEPWGDFSVEDMRHLQAKGLRIRFFRAPQKVFDSLSLEDVYHREINRDRGEVLFVTVSFETADLNLPEERIPLKRLSALREELASKRDELKQIERDYVGLTAHLGRLAQLETELTNLLSFQRARINTENELEGRLFVLRCWSPISEEDLLSKIGSSFTLHHYAEAPTDEDAVPVAMVNTSAFDSGEDLVKVYSYPSYKDFDPSGFVLYCFAVFFGMIVGDAGYGLTLLAVTFLLKHKFKSSSPFAVRFFRLMVFLGFSVTLYGILSGGYFGVALGPENPLAKLCLVDLNTKEGQNLAMILSIIIGMAHISLSFILRFKNTRDFAALGWIAVIWSGYFLINSKMGHGADNAVARYILVAGLAVVFLFSSTKRNPLLRVLEGLNGLLGIVQVFSDVLSYLRLFALGIATVYMAQTFNMLAKDIAAGIPWLGYLFAVLVLFAGHSVNLLLGIMGGVIHGLRLNFLEWYRWCFTGDGLVYKPFRVIRP